jgi:hypothetical protein
MSGFYDAANRAELERIEALLRRGGVEYSLRTVPGSRGMNEILVAEEDLFYAESLLISAGNQSVGTMV